MNDLNLNVSDAEARELTGPQIKAHIAAISGQPERKIATRSEGLRTLERLRMWARNQDGLLGIPKGTEPVVRSYTELAAKAKAKGKELETLPKPSQRLTPIDPEFDDPAEIVDGDEALAQDVEAPAPVQQPESPRAVPAPTPRAPVPVPPPNPAAPAGELAPWDRPNPAQVVSSADAKEVVVEVDGERIVHPRGTLRARLARQAMNATPIKPAYSATVDRRPKKETGEARKPREPLVAVRATGGGRTRQHKDSMRAKVYVFCRFLSQRELPGWPVGTVLPAEVDQHFGVPCKHFLHKLNDDGYLERVTPIVPPPLAPPKAPQPKAVENETVEETAVA